MLKIYGVYRSRATRPLWILEEIGMPFEHVPVIQAYKLSDPHAPDARLNSRSPEYLAVNPMGAIPAAEDNGLVLWESLAITLYLAKKYGGALGPSSVEEDAQMTQWSLFAATEIESNALKILTVINEGRSSTEAGQAELQALARLLDRPFRVLEQHFGQTEYAVAGRFTAADINIAEVVRYAFAYTPFAERYGHLAAWLKRCQQRPGYQAMWAKREAEVE